VKAEPLVSVVIPTFNSERFLERCLRSVKAQSYSNIETIVVDNYSTDGTREIAQSQGARVIQGYFNKPEARNVGILNSLLLTLTSFLSHLWWRMP
jgi:glycosyltransferase involved in cell wall biosynthesis